MLNRFVYGSVELKLFQLEARGNRRIMQITTMSILRKYTLISLITCFWQSGLVGSDKAPVVMSVVRHQTQMLPCRVDFSVTQIPKINVNWYRQTTGSNQEQLIVAGMLSINKKMVVNKDRPNEWNLVISRIDESDEGIYRCSWSSPFRTETVSLYDIQVDSPPVVDEDASTARYVMFREGETVNLTCIMTGRPQPTITWFRQHRIEFSPLEDIGVVGPVLTIPEISRYAGDIYVCRGENRHKREVWEIDVRVRFKPSMQVHEPIISASQGAQVSMSCLVESTTVWNSGVTWKWFNNENGLITETFKYSLSPASIIEGYPAEMSTLTLRQSLWDERDYGIYRCQATTKNHKVEGEIVLNDLHTDKHKHTG